MATPTEKAIEYRFDAQQFTREELPILWQRIKDGATPE